MPKHRIEIAQPAKRVLNSDVVFTVYSDDKRLGELSISRGSVDWRPTNKQQPYSVSWERFARLMENG